MVTALRITLSLYAAGIRSNLQYRANFLINVVMGVIYQGTGFAFIWVVLSRFETIAGWTLGEVAFLYGLRLMMHGTNRVLFSGLDYFDERVLQGEFDRYLVRPLPALLQIVGDRIQIGTYGDLIGGIGLFLAANSLIGVDWSPAALLYLVLAVMGGALVEAGLAVLLAALSFRLLSTGALFWMIDELFSSFGNYPLKIFGGTVQFLLIFALPVAFVGYFPATVLLGRTSELSVHPLFAYGAPLAGMVLFALAVRVFGRETRHYQSSGH